jgi:hypothetical protein
MNEIKTKISVSSSAISGLISLPSPKQKYKIKALKNYKNNA